MTTTSDAPAPALSGSGVRDDILLSLESIDWIAAHCTSPSARRDLERLTTSIRASLASDASPRGEAVAWRFRYPLHGGKFTHWEFETDADRIKWLTRSESEAQGEPLYAHPAPATVESADLELIRRLVIPMVAERSREPGDAWHRAQHVLAALVPATEGASR